MLESETYDQFISRVLETFPQAVIRIDGEDQLIIHTHLVLGGDDCVHAMDREE